MVLGLDLSEKNKTVDWTSLANSTFRFIYLKASEGLFKEDLCFNTYKQQAKAQGFVVGGYHWLDPKLNCKVQAEKFIQKISYSSGDLPPALCLDIYRSSLKDMDNNVQTFIDTVSGLCGKKPVIYTSSDYWRTNLPKAEWACKYPLWIDQPGSLFPGQLYPWASWTFWQAFYNTLISGVQNNVGINWFNGTEIELTQMVNQ
jgi:lysozyme